jgi:hypothetical protein
MTRQRLPNRRPSLTFDLEHDGHGFAVTVGFDPRDGCLREVFTHGAKAGSTMDGILDDVCVALSLLLQHGVEPLALASSMGRLGDRRSPASIVGALADLLSRAARP